MLVEICKQQQKKKTPKEEKATYSKRELNALARTILQGYTKMSNDILFAELSDKLKTMNTTMDERYHQVFGNKESKEKTQEVRLPSEKKRKSSERILQGKHKIKISFTRTETDASVVKAKVKTDIAKGKGSITSGSVSKIANLFLADRVDGQSILNEILQNNLVILFSVTNQGIRFHIPTTLDEIDYERMKFSNLPFSLDPHLLIQIDDKIGSSYVMYHRIDEQNMNKVGEYDIFDMKYVKSMSNDTPIKPILQRIYKEVSKDIRSV
jgi:hypothetical protein